MVGVDFTLRAFPSSCPLKNACGLLFSTVVTPFATPSTPLTAPDGPASSSVLARCSHCYAYINALCRLTSNGFHCSLCGRHTGLKGAAVQRYLRYPGTRDLLPELSGSCYEVLLEDGNSSAAAEMEETEVASSPAVLLLVDCSSAGGAGFGELVKSGLGAAVEALPPGTRLGLVGFSDRLTLVDLSGAAPAVSCLPLLESWPMVAALEDVLPLDQLLLPVEVARRNLMQALDLLLPSTAAEQARSAGAAASPAPYPPGSMQRDVTGSPVPSPGTPGRAQALRPSRGFGPALQAVLDYLRGVHTVGLGPPVARDGSESPILGTPRLLVFLSGPPDLGPGKTVITAGAARRSNGGQPAAGLAEQTGEEEAPGLLHHPHQDQATKVLYDGLALAAASLGAVLDLYVAAPGYVGLSALEGLANRTGGVMQLYPSLEEATLPHDIYRRVSTPLASACVLRVRTSRDLKVLRSYGRCYPEPQQEDLLHIPAADPSSTFVIDLDHTGAASPQLILDSEQAAAAGSWAVDSLGPMALQFAFQYDVVLPLKGMPRAASSQVFGSSSSLAGLRAGHPGGQGSSSSLLGQQGPGGAAKAAGGFQLVRKLRVCTVWVPVVQSPAEVYAGANTDAVLTVLAHKIAKAVRANGVAEARQLLRDWLTIFTINYHRNSYMRASTQQLLQLPVDLEFEGEPSLSRLPRLVYALLRSPLLSSAAAYHTDLTAFLHHLWGSIPCQELMRAVYPCLSAWSTADEVLVSELPLSKASLVDSYLVPVEAPGTPAAAQEAAGEQLPGQGMQSFPSFDSSAEPPAGILKSPSVGDASAAAAAAAAEGSSSSSKNVRFAHGSPVRRQSQGTSRPVRLYFLDAYILLLVLYVKGAEEAVPMPPPQDSKLWALISRIRKERRVTPHMEVVGAGDPGADLFASLLIDDPDEEVEGPAEGEAEAAAVQPTGLQHFLNQIRAEVVTQLHGQR